MAVGKADPASQGRHWEEEQQTGIHLESSLFSGERSGGGSQRITTRPSTGDRACGSKSSVMQKIPVQV